MFVLTFTPSIQNKKCLMKIGLKNMFVYLNMLYTYKSSNLNINNGICTGINYLTQIVSYPSIYTTIVTLYEYAYHCKNDSLVSHGYICDTYPKGDEKHNRIGICIGIVYVLTPISSS